MPVTFHFPINDLSLGQTSIALLREAYKKNLDCTIIPIGNVSMAAQVPDQEFEKWVNSKITSHMKNHSRAFRTIKLWHINGSLESFSNNQELITFHETDTLTPTEVNILSQQSVVWVTSSFTKEVFESYGLKNVVFLELGFDTHNFKEVNSRKYPKDVKVIGLGGKFENRKRTQKILRVLQKEFGNNGEYAIHAAVNNPFFNPEDNAKILHHTFNGVRPYNFPSMPAMPKNAEYNDFLNSCDVFLGMSGGEGRDLPVYQAACLGKKIVSLDAHAYKDYFNNENSWVVKPNAKFPAYDNIFFHPGADFNQGNFFDWDEKEFVEVLKQALAAPGPKRSFGYLTYADTFNTLISNNSAIRGV